MIRNFSANEVCSSGCVCFYAKNGVPCEQTLCSGELRKGHCKFEAGWSVLVGILPFALIF